MNDKSWRSQVRLPSILVEQLKKMAQKNHRSLNSEIVAQLQASCVADHCEQGKTKCAIDHL
jgi:Arc-like DNA binding domain